MAAVISSWHSRDGFLNIITNRRDLSRLRTNVLGGLLVCGDEFGGVSGQGSSTRVPCALWVGFLLVMYLKMKEEKEMENKSHGDGDGTLQYCLMAYLHHGFSREGEEKYN
ncbi:hypothetical protein OIU77_026766 [Salix suchowensis]|uniref:Uncharacterized protein n=1 Tax=Salix suchowensis TaxID=1278906 RepID=A0ABQ9BPB5_9ROSI|nr:hypothetical protein OIU77_026766 [Salix suchowensis]